MSLDLKINKEFERTEVNRNLTYVARVNDKWIYHQNSNLVIFREKENKFIVEYRDVGNQGTDHKC